MAMELKQSFVVKAPPDRVWAFLTDPRRAASALPGAAITEQGEDRSFAGTITVKVGPVSTQYRGRARFERMDTSTRSVEVIGSGQDVRGRGGAEMKMRSHLMEVAPGETQVDVVSEVNVTGILAQLGRGMIQDISDQLFQRFTTAVRAELERAEPERAEPPASGAAAESASAAPASANEPIQAVSFGVQVAGRVARRWAHQPAVWVGVAALAALVLWLLLR
jgi:carbon monoxide dehydrogenase subunit G